MLNDILNELTRKLVRNQRHLPPDETGIEDIKESCVVVLPAGGLGSRLQPITQETKTHKTSYRLPDGTTMIERVIAMYQDAGIRNFVALIYHHGESVTELLGDGSHLNVHIRYSEDPGKPVSRGGAIYHAIQQGVIPRGAYLIVHNPDDQIMRDDNGFVDDILHHHRHAEQQNAIATVVVASGSPYPFTGMVVDNHRVTSIEMYPMVPIPLHVGVTVFSPQATDYFLRHFNIQEKVDFESVLFPILVEEGRLSAKVIPPEHHIAVNDPKSYDLFLRRGKFS